MDVSCRNFLCTEENFSASQADWVVVMKFSVATDTNIIDFMIVCSMYAY